MTMETTLVVMFRIAMFEKKAQETEELFDKNFNFIFSYLDSLDYNADWLLGEQTEKDN